MRAARQGMDVCSEIANAVATRPSFGSLGCADEKRESLPSDADRIGGTHTAHAVLPAVGIDLIWVRQIERSLAEHGDRYLHRVYTSDEIRYADRSASERCRRLAARFAAKEAALKIIKPEGRWFDWRLIEVTRNTHGHCGLALHGEAATLADAQGLGTLSVSLSHEGDAAIAIVMGLRHPPRPQSGHLLLTTRANTDHD